MCKETEKRESRDVGSNHFDYVRYDGRFPRIAYARYHTRNTRKQTDKTGLKEDLDKAGRDASHDVTNYPG